MFKRNNTWLFGSLVLMIGLLAAGTQPVRAAKGSPPVPTPTPTPTSTPSYQPADTGTTTLTPEQLAAQKAASSQPFIAGPPPEGVILPSNDNIASATVVTSLPYTDSIDTTYATTESGEPSYSCGYNVGATVWYSYTPSSDGFFMIDTFGSGFDTVLNVFTDGTATKVACNDDAGGGLQSQVAINGDHTKTYLISVGGYNGAAGSLVFNMAVVPAFTGCSSVVDVPQAECAALRHLYNNTNGALWANSSGWLTIDHVCFWHGVSCESGHVSRLSLTSNNLTGAFTTDLTNLSYLQYLDLYYNHLTGNLATVISDLPTSLQSIDISNNDISGSIPSGLSGFSSLTEFYANYDSLTGDLGTAINHFPTTLEYLQLNGNSFTGTIPDMSGYTNLLTLDLADDQLSGDVSPFFDNLPSSITALDLGNNSLTGTFPVSTLNLTNLITLYIEGNNLGGDLGTAFSNIPLSVVNLNLGNNGFTGNIPTSIQSFTNLNYFLLTNNDGLFGTIPLEITNLNLSYFHFDGTYLCGNPDPTYLTWIDSVSNYYAGICGFFAPDLALQSVTFSPAHPKPGQIFSATIHVRNIGGLSTGSYELDAYDNRVITACNDWGDYGTGGASLIPGEAADITLWFPSGLTQGVHNLYFYGDPGCVVNDSNVANNGYGPIALNITNFLFQDNFETGDLSKWTKVNTGGGFLTACTQGALDGVDGACVARGTNDKRKQLIDQTPNNETVFNARFEFDVNSLSMAAGEPVRIMQMKMGSERPAFLVLRRYGGVYELQLNVKENDLSKLKTPWITISDSAHTIEVDWAAATAPGALNGAISLYIDGSQVGHITGLDNDTFTIASYRMGFTSRLAGKNISGTFYLDDVATSDNGYIGLP